MNKVYQVSKIQILWAFIIIALLCVALSSVIVIMITRKQLVLNNPPSLTSTKLTAILKPYSKVVTFSLEQVEQNYTPIKELKKKVLKKEKENEIKLRYFASNYKDKLTRYQKQKNEISLDNRQKIEAELENLKTVYVNLKGTFAMELRDLQFNTLNEFKINLQKFLKIYSKNQKYDCILNNNDNLVYFQNPEHDITKTIITELNKQYNSTKK